MIYSNPCVSGLQKLVAPSDHDLNTKSVYRLDQSFSWFELHSDQLGPLCDQRNSSGQQEWDLAHILLSNFPVTRQEGH